MNRGLALLKNLSTVNRRVLDMLRVHGPTTRSQLSCLTGISLTKIAEVTRQLARTGLVREGEGPSSGGRKPTLMYIKSDLFHTVGIDVGTQNLRAVVMDATGSVSASARRYKPLGLSSAIGIEDMLSIAREALARAGVHESQVMGIGVGVTGIVDEVRGTSLFVPGSPQMRDLPVVRLLQEDSKVSNVYITDSVRGMALAESRYGLGRGISNFVFVNVGVGLGAGIVVDGKVMTGSRGIVGELGHVYVGESNEICCCGNYGCLESIASGWALSRRVNRAMSNGVVTSIRTEPTTDGSDQIRDLIEAAKSGDKFAVNLLNEAADLLSLGTSTLVNLLNPQRIIVGGGLAEGAGELLMEPLTRRTKARSLPWLQSEIDIRLSELGEYSAARGVATLAMDKVFAAESAT
ncbi:MAG: ROK family protein [Bacillota bacterium]